MATPPTPETVPARQIIMMHFGRSGSTVLARLLAQHSRIAWLEEIFTLQKVRHPDSYDYSVGRMFDIVAARVAARRRPGQAGAQTLIVGHEIKLLNFLHNPSANLVDYIARASDETRYLHVVLRRRNTLRRIFSVYKAMATQVYHVDASDRGHAARTFRVNMANLFDPDTGQRAATLPELLTLARAREEMVLKNYDRQGIPYLALTYEDDIESDPMQAYRKVLEHAGLAPEPAEITLNKTGSSLRDEVVNFDAVEAALAGSEFEWMLR